ncbi:MAG: NADH-quinone oxidoreductase subunit C [Candidatus Aminicenantes bacterium]
MEKNKIIEDLQKKFPDKIKKTCIEFGDQTLIIAKDSLLDVAKFLKNNPYAYTMLLDLTCVDFPHRQERFQMVYHLFSLQNNHRLRIKIDIQQKDLTIDSLTSLWKNANWLEREVFDMFGIRFNRHPDMRRIFMYDGFDGYPLRKDYPLRKRQPRIKFRK